MTMTYLVENGKLKGKKIASRIFLLLLISCIAFSVNLFSAKQAHAYCDDRMPCAYDVTTDASSVTVDWYYNGRDPSIGWSVDFWQIRYADENGPQTQVYLSANGNSNFGSYTLSLKKLNPDDYYGFTVQACENQFLAPASCTYWSQPIYYEPFGPDTCQAGYVWRQAYSYSYYDHVCVTPAIRDQAAYDNSQASSRVDPNGAYGPDTCINGYVWREGDKGFVEDRYVKDHVCVTPATRDQTAYDNSQADSRKLVP